MVKCGMFQKPLIYLITKGNADSCNFSEESRQILEIVRLAVENQVDFVQIREKKLSARDVFELTRQAVQISRNTATKILVNDRSDVALAANADGVHLTSTSLSAKIIRQNFPPDFLIGVSCHSLADCENARNNGANFATYSPIYFSPNKGNPVGLAKLKEVCDALGDFPILALGGVDETNFSETLQNGASGIAAIRLLNSTETLAAIVRKIQFYSEKI